MILLLRGGNKETKMLPLVRRLQHVLHDHGFFQLDGKVVGPMCGCLDAWMVGCVNAWMPEQLDA